MGRKKLPPEQRKENAPKIAFRCTKTEQLAVGRKAAERNMKIDEIVRDAWELYDLIPRARMEDAREFVEGLRASRGKDRSAGLDLRGGEERAIVRAVVEIVRKQTEPWYSMLRTMEQHWPK